MTDQTSTSRASGAESGANQSLNPSARSLARWTLAVLGVAFVVRVVVYFQLFGDFVFDLPVGEDRGYLVWARQIVERGGISPDGSAQPTPYAYFLATIISVAGDSLAWIRLIQVALGATACALITQAGWQLVSRPTGIVAGLVLALHPAAIFSGLMLWPTAIEILLVCVLVTFMVDVATRGRLVATLWMGVVLGALVLTREGTIAFALVLVPWLLVAPFSPARGRLVPASVFAVGLLVVLVPATVLDRSAPGEGRLGLSSLAYSFSVGNGPYSDGFHLATVTPGSADQAALATLGRGVSSADVSGFYGGQALDSIRSDPAGWLGGMGRKLLLFVNHLELPDTEDVNVYGGFSPVLGAATWILHFGVLLPLAFLGVWTTWSDRRRLWPFYGLFVVQWVMATVFYVAGQDRLTVLPIVVLMAAAGLSGARAYFRDRPASKAVPAVIAVACVVAIVYLPISDARGVRSMTYKIIGKGLLDLGQMERAVLRYETALELDPENAFAHNDYGVILARMRAYGMAARHFAESVRLAPEFADAHFNLARARIDSYDPEGAIESYQRGLQLDPRRAPIYLELARVQRDVGDSRAAMQSYRVALQLDPGLVDARNELDVLQRRAASE